MQGIPYYRGLPFIGHALEALSNPLYFLRALNKKYEDVVKIKIAGKKFYIVQNPETCRHILQENARNYFKPGTAKEMKRFLGNGLATSNGELWLRQRRLMQPAFHRKKIEALVSVINKETISLTDKWKNNSSPHTENISDFFLNLTLGNITKAMFGTDLHRSLHEITPVVNKLLLHATKKATAIIKFPEYIPTPSNIQFKHANKAFEKIIYRIIEQRQKDFHAGKENDDLLDMLINAFDDDSRSYMTVSQLRDEITTIFMAGHETTAQTLSWVFYQLATNRSVYEKARMEASTFVQGDITLDTLQKLVYIKNIIEETLRLYPPVWVMARKSINSDNINSTTTLPPGSTVLINVYGMHYNDTVWRSPDTFDPGNFKTTQPPHPFGYLPFGGGQRICIGKQFAMMVMQTVVALLVKDFEFETLPGHKPVVVAGLTLRAKGGLRLRIKKIL